ncbi:MAG: FMN-binding protein [Bacteroidales bacterium]|nr:FMN-binding protein [Candidatus Sodaliphilus limicaballi]
MKFYKTMAVAAALMLIACAQADAKTAPKKKSSPKAQAEQVIFTGELAKRVIGYSSTTPLNITIKDGKIAKIEALPNKETPQYFKKAATKVFAQYEGLTIDQALKLKADVATGATYSSEALIKNIQMGLQQAPGKK